MRSTTIPVSTLRVRGIEVLSRGGSTINLPQATRIEAPASPKRTRVGHPLELGASISQVSGYYYLARIGHGREASGASFPNDKVCRHISKVEPEAAIDALARATVRRPVSFIRVRIQIAKDMASHSVGWLRYCGRRHVSRLRMQPEARSAVSVQPGARACILTSCFDRRIETKRIDPDTRGRWLVVRGSVGNDVFSGQANHSGVMEDPRDSCHSARTRRSCTMHRDGEVDDPSPVYLVHFRVGQNQMDERYSIESGGRGGGWR